MTEIFICGGVRTPFGRYGGVLNGIRADDLAALPIRALMERNPQVDWERLDEVYYGCANQAGEDNRNVARMAALLAGLPQSVPASTINRLCGSSLDAVAIAARAIRSGEADLILAGGVESMTRTLFVVGKADSSFSRNVSMEDTTLGWRFVNPLMKSRYGMDSMAETAENLVTERGISREDQDLFVLRSQMRYVQAARRGFFKKEILSVKVARARREPLMIEADEHPRPETTPEALAKLKGIVRPDGSVTAGNSSGINDGAGAILLASEKAVARLRWHPERGSWGALRRAWPRESWVSDPFLPQESCSRDPVSSCRISMWSSLMKRSRLRVLRFCATLGCPTMRPT